MPIILITHETNEYSVRRALEKIGMLDDVVSVDATIRVES